MSAQPSLQDIRRLLFTPCASKEHMEAWMLFFLGIRLPNRTVSEESNSNPVSLMWEIYSHALNNDIDELSSIMAYASRFGAKTLGASILEIFTVLHLRRDVIHMAAITDQSEKAQEYVKTYLSKPYIRDFRAEDNARQTSITWYEDIDSHIYTEKEVADLSIENRCTRHANYIKIIPCTMSGTNSSHTNGLFCVDGGTKVFCRSTKEDRDRKPATVRGIFRALQGRSPGGKPGDEKEESITPTTNIELLGFDLNTMQLGFGRITNAICRKAPTLRLTTQDGHALTCTPDHPIFSDSKTFVEARLLRIGDKIAYLDRAKTERTGPRKIDADPEPQEDPTINSLRGGDVWEQVLMGSLLGDMGIYRKSGNNAYVAEQHCVAQAAYMEWKRSILHYRIRTRDKKTCLSGYTQQPLVGFSSGNSKILNEYVSLRTDLTGIDRLQALGLAVWYMDDGCAGKMFRLSTEGWGVEHNIRIRDFLLEKFNIPTSVRSYRRGDKVYYHIVGGVDAKRRLVELVAPYIHPDMAYKFDLTSSDGKCPVCGVTFRKSENRKDCGKSQCKYWRLNTEHPKESTIRFSEIASIEPLGEGWVYDFTIEGIGNFWTNGLLSKNCTDEIDVIPSDKIRAYHQAKSIPSSSGGIDPISLYISTRKSRVGLVQAELDRAEKTGLQVRHWNIIDVTETCPPTRHLPDEPRQTYYVNDNDVNHISRTEFEQLPELQRKPYYPAEGFAGCGKCRLFAACKGRLATHQKADAKDTIAIASIRDIISKFRQAPGPEYIITEYLSRKPDASGMVYPRLDEQRHRISAAEMAALVLGEEVSQDYTKNQLISLLQEKGADFVSGMDFGFSHLFSTVTVASYGPYAFVLDCFSQAGLELDDQVRAVTYLKDTVNPSIYPDTAYPGSIKTFKRYGFRMRDWEKGPGSVAAGIEIVRYMLYAGDGQVRMFFLRDDPGVETLFNKALRYRLKMDAAGRYTEVPEKEDDDELDALRMAIMNKFGRDGAIKVKDQTVVVESSPQTTLENTNQPGKQQKWMMDLIHSHVDPSQSNAGPIVVKKGKFTFSSGE